MKHYEIYQFFVDLQGRERWLLVGFTKAKDESEAISNYTDDDFKAEYLTAIKCTDDAYRHPVFLEIAKQNKKELGVWA